MPSINLRLLMEPDTVQLEITNEQCNTIKEKVKFLQNTLSEIDYCLMLRENIQEAFEDFREERQPRQPKGFEGNQYR